MALQESAGWQSCQCRGAFGLYNKTVRLSRPVADSRTACGRLGVALVSRGLYNETPLGIQGRPTQVPFRAGVGRFSNVQRG